MYRFIFVSRFGNLLNQQSTVDFIGKVTKTVINNNTVIQ